jgi:acetolactate synthase-1/2/3 large subunit
MRLTGGQILAHYLIRQGVPYAVGIPGHGCWAIVDAFADFTDRLTTIQVCTSRAPSTWLTATTG